MANVEQLLVEIKADIDDLKQGYKQAGKETKRFSGVVDKIGPTIAAAFAADKIIAFAKEIVRVRGEFQKFEAVLSNTLGSNSAAQIALKDIQNFASQTPFQVNELTAAFVKLANQGFKPNMDEMGNLADLAASTGKNFDQLAEAILDAQTNEFERLKEFGVKARQAGDRVTFTFKGISTTVNKSSEEIRKYLIGLGDLKGVSGSTAKIMGTLEGQQSNLNDAITNFKNELGKLVEDEAKGFLAFLSTATKQTTGFLAVLNNPDINNWRVFKAILLKDFEELADISADTLKAVAREDLSQSIKANDDLLKQLVEKNKELEKLTGRQNTENRKLIEDYHKRVEGAKNVARFENVQARILKTETAELKKQLDLITKASDAIVKETEARKARQRQFVQPGQQLETIGRDQAPFEAPRITVADVGQIGFGFDAVAHFKFLNQLESKTKGAFKTMNDEFQLSARLANALGPEFDLLSAQAATMENTIVSLIEAGVNPHSQSLQALITKYQQLSTQIESQNQAFEQQQQLLQQLTTTSAAFGETFGQALAQSGDASKALATAMKAAVGEMINQLFQLALAQIAASSAKFGPIGIGVATAAVAAMKGLFNSQIKGARLAEGGLVTAPTRALLGEQGPELVMPLKNLPRDVQKLGLSGSGKHQVEVFVRGEIDGQTIRIVQDNHQRHRQRTT